MIDPSLPDRLATILPGAWQPCPQGYALATPAGLLTVRAPHNQYLVRLNDGDTAKTYAAADLPALIRRALGAELFDALAAIEAQIADLDREIAP